MFGKLFALSLVVAAGLALAFPAAAQPGCQPGPGRFPAMHRCVEAGAGDRCPASARAAGPQGCLTLAAMMCRPGQEYDPSSDSCVDKGQARPAPRCAAGQSYDPAQKHCVATAKPASAPPAAAPAAAAPAPAAVAPSVSAPPTATPPIAPSASAPPTAPKPTPAPSATASPATPPASAQPGAASSGTCPADQEFDPRMKTCMPSVSAGAPPVRRIIPGDPLRH
jgi:hypothetical protein